MVASKLLSCGERETAKGILGKYAVKDTASQCRCRWVIALKSNLFPVLFTKIDRLIDIDPWFTCIFLWLWQNQQQPAKDSTN